MTYWQTFKSNLAAAWRHISTYVVFLVTGLWAYWLQLSPADQAAIEAVVPQIHTLAPVLSLVAFLLAKGLPQNPPAPPPTPPADKTEERKP